MQFFARRSECGHIVWAGPLADTAATLQVSDRLRGGTCPSCRGPVRTVEFIGVRDAGSSFDSAPAPRNAVNKLRKATKADARRCRERLLAMGADVGGLAADLARAARGLTPQAWRAALARIPVGVLDTREPNAECIRFAGVDTPAIVIHQGLASYLHGMNRSLVPLLRVGALGEEDAATHLVENPRTRQALRVQAVHLALDFLGVGRPAPAGLVEVPDLVRFVEMPLTRTMAAFVLCHEYGHAVHNHADDLRGLAGQPRASVLERSRAMELEADVWGQDAVTGAFVHGALEPSLAVLDDLFGGGVPDLKADVSHAAPCLALLLFGLLDTVEDRLAAHGVVAAVPETAPLGRRARGDADSTHPSNQERFLALHAHLRGNAGPGAQSWVDGYGRLVDELVDDLDATIDRTGALDRRLRSRLGWLRRRRPVPPAPPRDSGVTTLADDPDLRGRLEAALDAVPGDTVALDPAVLQRRFAERRRRADACLERQEYREAARLYGEILDDGETADSIALYPSLALCRERLGDLAGAEAAYRRSMDVAEGSDAAAWSGLLLGQILMFERGDRSGARAPLTIAAGSGVTDVRVQATLWLGMIAHDEQDHDTALRLYREVYDGGSAELTIFTRAVPVAALNIGSLLRHRGRTGEAARMLVVARDHPDSDAGDREAARQWLQEDGYG